jgi:hypothetical protein
MTSTSEATPIETLTHDPNPDPVGDVTKPYPIPGHATLHSEMSEIYIYIYCLHNTNDNLHQRLGVARISVSRLGRGLGGREAGSCPCCHIELEGPLRLALGAMGGVSMSEFRHALGARVGGLVVAFPPHVWGEGERHHVVASDLERGSVAMSKPL